MNSILKKVIFVVAFILLTLVLPAIVLLLFIDSSTSFSVYVITYGVIIFGILGYIVSSVRNMEKKLEEAMDEIKMQNAAIAYKISNGGFDLTAAPQAPVAPVVEENEPVQTSNIPLNPAEPLVFPEVKKAEKTSVDDFDDFK